MGDCQNYGPFLGPYYNTGPNLGDPKRDHSFDNPPYGTLNRPQDESLGHQSLLFCATPAVIGSRV